MPEERMPEERMPKERTPEEREKPPGEPIDEWLKLLCDDIPPPNPIPPPCPPPPCPPPPCPPPPRAAAPNVDPTMMTAVAARAIAD